MYEVFPLSYVTVLFFTYVEENYYAFWVFSDLNIPNLFKIFLNPGSLLQIQTSFPSTSYQSIMQNSDKFIFLMHQLLTTKSWALSW